MELTYIQHMTTGKIHLAADPFDRTGHYPKGTTTNHHRCSNQTRRVFKSIGTELPVNADVCKTCAKHAKKLLGDS